MIIHAIFNRPVKTYSPSFPNEILPSVDVVQKNQNQKHKRIKEYSNKHQNVGQLTLNIGVIKNEDSKLYPTLFKFLEIKYTIATVKSDNGKNYTGYITNYTRHIAFFKNVNLKISQTI